MTLWGGARRTSSTLAAIGTTSYDVRGLRRPAAASQGLLDLREELVPSHAESEQWQPSTRAPCSVTSFCRIASPTICDAQLCWMPSTSTTRFHASQQRSR